jgi:hypothetical protein
MNVKQGSFDVPIQRDFAPSRLKIAFLLFGLLFSKDSTLQKASGQT